MSSMTPLYAKANIGLEHVFRLEQTLDAGIEGTSSIASTGRFQAFRRIECQGITFSYRDAAGNATFSTGPWDLSLERGQIIFLLGGNGSGKSTALKLLSGLYPPDAGRIMVDGEVVSRELLQEYRELYAVIFPDFHLFDRLHGLEGVAPAVVKAQIEAMELTGKVEFVDGRFTTLDLSTGQRKRLAMIAALLEDREIYVFDEWAADQDSHFREVFYTKILTDLKSRGKSVVVVTHDAGYACDRIIDLDLGSFVARPGVACSS